MHLTCGSNVFKGYGDNYEQEEQTFIL